ncbi:MAG: NrtA/SsuA/CpmA family ABC transporter substrate-binding protein [Magnetococcales bacterium]|nr:NrtA/SsuA/CpmA family ABC transporter substrate-binding protein [Magnetococcales bacterium]
MLCFFVLAFVISRWVSISHDSTVKAGDNSSYDRHHDFGTNEKILDLGIQPLWLPAGIVAEVMKRDRHLRRELRKLGMEIRFHPFSKGADVNRSLHSGQLEGGMGGDMPTISACANGPVRVTSLMDMNFTAIVSRDFMVLSDLRGLRLGYAFGSNAHYMLLSALERNGLNEADVTLVSMDAPDMLPALERGDIEAFSAWEPITTLATQRHGFNVIHKFLSTGYLYFAHTFAERHPEAVERLVAAQFRALRWLERSEAHLSLAVSWSTRSIHNFLGKEFALTANEMKPMAQKSLRHLWSLPLFPRNGMANDGHLEQATRFLGRIGKIPPHATWTSIKNCFHPETGERILKDANLHHLDVFDIHGVLPE